MRAARLGLRVRDGPPLPHAIPGPNLTFWHEVRRKQDDSDLNGAHATCRSGFARPEARDRMGVILDPPDAKFLEPHVERVRAKLGPAAFAAAERRGRAVPYESALAEARRWVEEG